ncbi:MAG: phenylalanine--tRNA ligase subunit beta [Candidatus Neomarinimicrobiota bacterium]
MIVALDWLKDFVDIGEAPSELADLLTMLGFEAESDTAASNLDNIVAARVTKTAKHPNADKLTVCEVFDGTDSYQILCGAPNVREGQMAVLARVGAVLPDGMIIKKAKIRGEESHGMLCSERELNLSDQHEGIIHLPDSAQPGQAVTDLLPFPLPAVEFDITPNRPDCLSHLGIAREIAVKTGRALRLPPIRVGDALSNAVCDYVTVEIDDPVGCPRYIAGIVRNIKIGPSPQWLVKRLEAAGMRSINNVVDISNYVLLETGHPTHIFDYKFVPTKKIVVRRAAANEAIVTLDEVERRLTDQHLLITDGQSPIAIAGIMGGERSGVSAETTTVLIESAYFDPVTIRKGSKALGLITESSRRFERGADPNAAPAAFWRIVNLLEDLASGQAVPGFVDEYPGKITTPVIDLRRTELDLVSGCVITDEFIETSFTGLGIDWQRNDSGWTCIPPTFRPDLEREIDLIEEIVRIHGYDNIPVKHTYSGVYDLHVQDEQSDIGAIVQILSGMGFNQCFSNSLQSAATARSSGAKPVKLLNPLNEEMSHVRTTLLPGLLFTADFNIKNGAPDLMLYEVGQVFRQEGDGFAGIVENMRLTGIVHGLWQSVDIHRNAAIAHSHFSVKGIVQTLLSYLKLTGCKIKSSDGNTIFTREFQIRYKKQLIGQFGEINPGYISGLGITAGPVFGFDLDLTLLLREIAADKATLRYQPISIYPRMERDLNFVLDERIAAQTIINSITSTGGQLLRSVQPLNIFRHESLGPGKMSMTFRLLFQSPDRTLEDNEVTSIINEIIVVVEKDFGAKLRT